MSRRSAGLGERHQKILKFLEEYQTQFGYPPSIREIGEKTGISSTSVVNYYLDQLERKGLIERESHISRGIRLVKPEGEGVSLAEQVKQTAGAVSEAINNLVSIPVVGRIFASNPVPVPPSDFNYYDAESSIDLAASLLPPRDKISDLFALEVQGESMIDAMVNEGDIVVMKRAQEAKNGDMVAVWLTDRDETTLKYFYKEGNRIRLQPANPTMQPIYVEDPRTVQVQGKVVMVIRRVESVAA